MRYAMILGLMILGWSVLPLPQAEAADATELHLPPMAIAPEITSEGVGGQVAFPLIRPYLDLNLGYTRLSLRENILVGSTPFIGNLRLAQVPVYVSYFPFAGNFHFDAGAMYNRNQISVTGDVGGMSVGDQLNFDGHTYTMSAAMYDMFCRAHATFHTNFNQFSPYVGIGYGNPFIGGSWTFQVSVGALFEGGSRVSLSGNMNAIPAQEQASAASQISQDERSINGHLRLLNIYPLVNIGLYYRF